MAVSLTATLASSLVTNARLQKSQKLWSSAVATPFAKSSQLSASEYSTCRIRPRAVGEAVILMTPPCVSLLKHLIKVRGGSRMTVSPTANQALALDVLPEWTVVAHPEGLLVRYLCPSARQSF